MAGINYLTKSGYDRVVVIGAGALGTFLAWDQSLTKETFLVGHKHFPQEVRIRHTSDKAELYSAQWLPIKSLTKEWISQANTVFYFCLPPGTTWEIWQELRDELLQVDGTNCLLFFCENGIFDKRVLLDVTASSSISVWRALFFAGFERSHTSQDTAEIMHNGGRKVVAQCLHNPMSVARAGSFFNWELAANIGEREAEKFFVNFILAYGVQNRLLKNKELQKLLPLKEIEEWADVFCLLFAKERLKVENLLTRLQETILLTGENINSVSRAWNQGNDSIYSYFVQVIKSQAQKNDCSRFKSLLGKL